MSYSDQFEPQLGDVKVENKMVYQYDILGDDYDTESWCVLCPLCDFADLYPDLVAA